MKLIFSVIGFIFISVSVFSTSYYVSNLGDNSNSGLSPSSSFLTIQFAADLAVAGDTVFVADGTYAGFDFRDKNGTMSNPIVFRAIGNNALINQKGPIRDDGINIENADYIVIEGFLVNNMPGNGNGIRLVLSDNCVVRNCSCDNNAERGIFTGFTDDILIEYNSCSNSVDEHGIYVSNSSDRPIIRYNECFGNNNTGIHINGDLSAGGDGIISDAQIYGNILRDNNLAAALNMDGVEHPVIYNNLIYNNHFGQGIAMFQIDGAIVTHGAKIYNNTIVVPSDGRWGILMTNGANVDTEIYNNIIINQHTWRGCISAESTAQLTSNYNIVDDKLSNNGDGSTISFIQWQALGLDLNSQITGAFGAIFQNFASNDFSLISNSQALDIGTHSVSSIVQSDLVGTTRPLGAGFDIGAYEYESALPVDVIDFNTSLHSNSILLKWFTANEIDLDGFDIEHSTDGVNNWNRLEFVNAQGNEENSWTYEYLHKDPAKHENYYRLKKINNDGGFSYSEVKYIRFHRKNKVTIFPNPTNQYLNISGLEIGQKIIISNSVGKLVYQTKANSGNTHVYLPNLIPGIYYVVIQNKKDEILFEEKIVLHH